MSEFFVKVGKVPGTIQEVVLDGEEGATVVDVLELANLSVEAGYSVRLNGDPIDDLDTEVSDDDSVTLVREIKGNLSTVKVGKVPGMIQTVAIDTTTTIAQALELAGVKVETGYSVRHNGEAVTDLNRRLDDDDSVTIIREVRGNG